jgi:hypothetical protein
MMADALGPGLCQAKPPSHATQPLRFGIGFMVALALPLSNAQWLVYKMEFPTCLRHVCMYARSERGVVGVCSYGVPLGSRRRGNWLPYICISSCHSSFLVVWWFRPFLHSIVVVLDRRFGINNASFACRFSWLDFEPIIMRAREISISDDRYWIEMAL